MILLIIEIFSDEILWKRTNFKNPKEFLRINLKDKIKTIIEKVLEDFNLKVNEWHYFFYYYNQIEKNDYYKVLVNTCNKNDIEYFFFDTNKEIFMFEILTLMKKKTINI